MANENTPTPIGGKIQKLGAASLCALTGKLCLYVKAQVGSNGFRGGICPGSVLINADKEPSLAPLHEGDWSSEELCYLPPELFWNGVKSPAGDVYSLGLLLYYASVGRLPFEDRLSPDEAREKRMNGDSFTVPKSVNRRLREIILRATAFKAADRYATPGELKAALDSCVENKFVAGDAGAALFHKDGEQLTDIEKMMLEIVAANSAVEPDQSEDEGEETSAEEIPDEAEEAPAEESAGEAPEEPAEPENEEAEEIEAGTSEAEAEEKAEAAEETTEEEAEETPEEGEDVSDEDVTVVPDEPKEKPESEHVPIPILTVEEHPELEPIVPERNTRTEGIQYDRRIEQEHKIRAEVQKRRRRPVLFILILCTLVIFAALLFNAINGDEGTEPGSALLSDPTPMPTLPVIITPEPTAEPEVTPVPETTAPLRSVYTLYYEDVSWNQAQQRCIEMGGHLMTISNEDEFNQAVSIANDKGATYVWVGCHRVGSELVWENGESIDYYRWDVNEPSLYDGAIKEDYVMLWNHNGQWCYNDSRDNLLDESAGYSGRIAYICETYEP